MTGDRAYRIDPERVPAGWLVEVVFTTIHHRTGQPVSHPSYWYGPTSGFGSTSGPFTEHHRGEESPGLWHWYPTRKAAEADLRAVGLNRRRYVPRRVRDVLAERVKP